MDEDTGQCQNGFFCFDTLCMINVTNARINIISITASYREYRLSVAHNSQESVTTLPRPLVGWGWGGIWAAYSQENH